MDGGESFSDTLFDEGSVGGGQDVEMVDLEDGELADGASRTGIGGIGDDYCNKLNQESDNRKSRNRKKKKRNKGKRGGSTNSGPNVTDINRFVLDTCKRLREKKSYLMWTAVGVLGVSALSDLVQEVNAIQACGGQKTADGSRFRNGGGILWKIIKVRDPNAYKEIMRKGKEFENQFKKQYHGKPRTEASDGANDEVNPNPRDVLESKTHDESQIELEAEHKRVSVHDRIRVPVSYDDDLLGEENDSTAHCS